MIPHHDFELLPFEKTIPDAEAMVHGELIIIDDSDEEDEKRAEDEKREAWRKMWDERFEKARRRLRLAVY